MKAADAGKRRSQVIWEGGPYWRAAQDVRWRVVLCYDGDEGPAYPVLERSNSCAAMGEPQWHEVDLAREGHGLSSWELRELLLAWHGPEMKKIAEEWSADGVRDFDRERGPT